MIVYTINELPLDVLKIVFDEGSGIMTGDFGSVKTSGNVKKCIRRRRVDLL